MPFDARLAPAPSTRADTRPSPSRATRTSFASVDMLNEIHFALASCLAQRTGGGQVFGDAAISALTTSCTTGQYPVRLIGSSTSISHRPTSNCMRCDGQFDAAHRLGAGNGVVRSLSAWESIPSSGDQVVRLAVPDRPAENDSRPLFSPPRNRLAGNDSRPLFQR